MKWLPIGLLVLFPTIVCAECYEPKSFSAKADALPGNVRIASDNGRFYFEFLKSGGDEPEGAPFFTQITIPRGIYRFTTSIQTGNVPETFEYTVSGLKKPIHLSLAGGKSRRINQKVEVISDVQFSVRSVTYGKTWSWLGPTKFCR